MYQVKTDWSKMQESKFLSFTSSLSRLWWFLIQPTSLEANCFVCLELYLNSNQSFVLVQYNKGKTLFGWLTQSHSIAFKNISSIELFTIFVLLSLLMVNFILMYLLKYIRMIFSTPLVMQKITAGAKRLAIKYIRSWVDSCERL